MKTVFIINPKSGKGMDRDRMLAAIRLNFPDAEWALTERAGHATELAQKAVERGYDAVIAVGGDGTINETAKPLVGTRTALGVVPRGSGNGFARTLGMPMLFEEALPLLQKARSVPCDVGTANGEYFLNLAGVGIEAEIARLFAEQGKNGPRGKWPYFKLGFKTVWNYKPKMLEVTSDGKTEMLRSLTLVFANGTQYGSNFKIAPNAKLGDGLLERVEVLPVGKWKLVLAAPTFFFNNWRPLAVTRSADVKETVISYPGEIVYHVDGEPRVAKDELKISVVPRALRILLPH